MKVYWKNWTERKYVDGVPTDEYRLTDERYDDEEHLSEEECMKNNDVTE